MTAGELTIESTWEGRSLPQRERATVRLSRTRESLQIDVDAPFRQDPPPPGAPGPTDGLWAYQVVEVFVVAPGERYTEIELSPHGHHWVLRLEGIRQAVEKGIDIEFTPRIEGARWRGTARIELRHLPDEPRWCNAYRISGTGAERTYHAWSPVPGDKPDFHRLAAFGPWPWAP